MLWSVILGGNTKNNQVSAQYIFEYNYYLYLCNSKLGLTQDSSIYPSREQYFQVGSIIFSSTHIKLIKMEKIIGREAEFGKLTDYMESGKSEFIALYGRRHHIRTQGEYVFGNITSPDYTGRTVWTPIDTTLKLLPCDRIQTQVRKHGSKTWFRTRARIIVLTIISLYFFQVIKRELDWEMLQTIESKVGICLRLPGPD